MNETTPATIDTILFVAGLLDKALYAQRHFARARHKQIPGIPAGRCRNYFELICYISKELKHANCRITVDERRDAFQAHIESDTLTGKPKQVILNRYNRMEGLSIIWDLIHEYAHAINGLPSEHDIGNQEHEMAIWQEGFDALSHKYPVINSDELSFESWRDDCLRTYRE